MIQDKKLAQLFNLQKRIEVVSYELSKRLCIYYIINAEPIEIDADQSEACQLLKEAGLITEFAIDNNGNPYLRWQTTSDTEKNGQHIQDCRTVYGSFEEFVEQTKFRLFDANTIAALYELNKQNQKTIV